MVVVVATIDPHLAGVDRAFLGGLAQRPLNGGLVARAGATEQPPRAAEVAPLGAVL